MDVRDSVQFLVPAISFWAKFNAQSKSIPTCQLLVICFVKCDFSDFRMKVIWPIAVLVAISWFPESISEQQQALFYKTAAVRRGA